MFNRLFSRAGTADRHLLDAVYGEIVAAARQPVIYADWHVPDTPLGRYEMISLHLLLVLNRLRDLGMRGKDLAQNLTDEFFKDVEHSIRELGIGDMGVPKRMKKLVRMFYGRAAAYDAALRAGDEPALAAALHRNVRPDLEAWPEATALAAYALATTEGLALIPEAEFLSPGFRFPRCEVAGEAAA